MNNVTPNNGHERMLESHLSLHCHRWRPDITSLQAVHGTANVSYAARDLRREDPRLLVVSLLSLSSHAKPMTLSMKASDHFPLPPGELFFACLARSSNTLLHVLHTRLRFERSSDGLRSICPTNAVGNASLSTDTCEQRPQMRRPQ